MTIREVLEADWNVDRIFVTVRELDTAKYIMCYCIGKDVGPGNNERLVRELKCGDIYEDAGMKTLKTLYMQRIIQHYQLDDIPKSKTGLRGVLIKQIPKELLELKVEHMSPMYYGWSNDNLHGYTFDCYVGSWNGIVDEYEQINLEN